MTKPTVFNYKNHEELRQAYKELLADNQQLTADNRKLRKEVTELKQLNDGYVKIIAKNQETNNKLMASVQKQTGGDLISRADAIEAVRCKDCDNTVPHWYMLNGKRVDCNWCVEMESEVDDDEYCSRAVPKGTREKVKGGNE